MMSPQTVFFPHHLLLGHWTCSAGADLQGRRNLPRVASSHMIPAFPSVGLSICHCIMFRLWVFCLLFMFFLCGVSVKIANPMNVFVVIFPDAVQFADLLTQLLRTSAHLLQERSSFPVSPATVRAPRCSLQTQTWKAAFCLLSSVWNQASAVPGISAVVSARSPVLCHITAMAEHLHTAFIRVSSLSSLLQAPVLQACTHLTCSLPPGH